MKRNRIGHPHQRQKAFSKYYPKFSPLGEIQTGLEGVFPFLGCATLGEWSGSTSSFRCIRRLGSVFLELLSKGLSGDPQSPSCFALISIGGCQGL